MPGLHRNLELNIDVQDSDATEKLATWFEQRWDDRFSLRITEEIIDLISESWADEQQPTPFEVYLKVCHSLAGGRPRRHGLRAAQVNEELLLDYQETAVRTLARRIVRRGGTMLGDVVGLGKTLTAVATALMLRPLRTTQPWCCARRTSSPCGRSTSRLRPQRPGRALLDGRQGAAGTQAVQPRHLR